jgi:hypothetical protein
MKIFTEYKLGVASAVLLAIVNYAGAVGILDGMSLGTAAPPTTLGGWSMTPFGPDASPLDSLVTTIGPVNFNQAVTHQRVGVGWGTWSHGYSGDVYHTAWSANQTSLAMTFSSSINALYFYTEPVNFASFTFTATTQDGTTLSQVVYGDSGAAGFGFWGGASDVISLVTVTGTDTLGFAIGEFGVHVIPEPSSFALAGLGAAALVIARRRK